MSTPAIDKEVTNKAPSHTGTLDAFDRKIDSVRRGTAETLESAAGSVRHAGHESAAAIASLADDAGERLDSTAKYVRTFEGGDTFANFRRAIRLHPVGSLAMATAAGVVAGICWSYTGRRH
jgi:hypothetical protein